MFNLCWVHFSQSRNWPTFFDTKARCPQVESTNFYTGTIRGMHHQLNKRCSTWENDFDKLATCFPLMIIFSALFCHKNIQYKSVKTQAADHQSWISRETIFVFSLQSVFGNKSRIKGPVGRKIMFSDKRSWIEDAEVRSQMCQLLAHKNTFTHRLTEGLKSVSKVLLPLIIKLYNF